MIKYLLILTLWHWCLHSFTPLVYLCSLWSPVHFDAQVVSVPLPVQFAVNYVEEVPDADLLTGGHLHQSHSGWDVFVLWYPERYDVVTRRPGEVPEETGWNLITVFWESFHIKHNHSKTVNVTHLIPVILRLFLSSKPMDWKKQRYSFTT